MKIILSAKDLLTEQVCHTGLLPSSTPSKHVNAHFKTAQEVGRATWVLKL